MRDEDDGEGRQDDPVGKDPPLDVDRRERDQDGAEERGEERLAGEPEPEEAGGDEKRRDELDGEVADADRGSAAPAAAAENDVGDERDVVVPGELAGRTTWQADLGLTSERFSGSRATTTFKKLPTASAGAKTSPARASSTLSLSAATS